MTAPADIQAPWEVADLTVSLLSHVACGWPESECPQEAVWMMIQHHLRPPVLCHRTPLCDEHHDAVVAQDRKWAADRRQRGLPGVLVCTLHLRPVEALSRWEHL